MENLIDKYMHLIIYPSCMLYSKGFRYQNVLANKMTKTKKKNYMDNIRRNFNVHSLNNVKRTVNKPVA